MKFLKKHPFRVQAFFERSVVLTFAVPKEELQGLIPACLALDLFQDKWAFIAIAMVETSGLRPKGFPAFLGNDFFLMGTRIFVRYTNKAGKRLRGLYILQSQTNKKKMEWLGNLFTHYNYSTTDIHQTQQGQLQKIHSNQSNFQVHFEESTQEIPLPPTSPFQNWKEARRFAGPLPHTFTYDALNKKVLIIRGLRQNWTPTPIIVQDYQFEFLDQLALSKVVLANAFIIKEVPYEWEKGKIESWK
ncbi:MAG: DUF2071 domain-containing protein [Aureispira sp.]